MLYEPNNRKCVNTGKKESSSEFCRNNTEMMAHKILLNPVHTSNNVEATFDFVAKKATMSNEFALKFRPFDKVERCFDTVAQNGNIVEATGNKVACCFDNVASTLLIVWTGLHCPCTHTQTHTGPPARLPYMERSRK